MKTSASQHKMPCPNCHSPETRCMKSMYIAMTDYTEELWECEVCKARWERTQKVTVLRKGEK